MPLGESYQNVVAEILFIQTSDQDLNCFVICWLPEREGASARKIWPTTDRPSAARSFERRGFPQWTPVPLA